MIITLPISKSIANRVLIREALRGNKLSVPSNAPNDVILLNENLRQLKFGQTLDLKNCGTAMRFLTAYCAQKEGVKVTLTGCNRMKKRPIGQLVDALRELGAKIDYLEQEGFPPLLIKGKKLSNQTVTINDPQSTQFISALLLIGKDVDTNVTSPYIELTKDILKTPTKSISEKSIERDWSSAAFWYEDIALHGGEHFLEGLYKNSMQGDKVLADIFAQLGVKTEYKENGIRIKKTVCSDMTQGVKCLIWDFSNCQDLYPAVAITCERLGIETEFTGLDSLRIKESDRIQAVMDKRSYHDHRMAMALMAADYAVDDVECVVKSYPHFVEQWLKHKGITIIIPRRGINDDNKGKKYALNKLISKAETEYVWLRDDDVKVTSYVPMRTLSADMYILPLTMRAGLSHLERLQRVEYDGIQNLTMKTANHGHAVMCSGANLIVKRNRWLESYKDLHLEIPSGDDMFLLESFKRRGLKVETFSGPYAEAVAIDNWKDFWHQRMRWAGKALKYKDKDIILCGLIVSFINFLAAICPIFYVPKYLIERKFLTRKNKHALLLSFLYPWYMLICLVGGQFRKHTW